MRRPWPTGRGSVAPKTRKKERKKERKRNISPNYNETIPEKRNQN
jgi:hypothetical protein